MSRPNADSVPFQIFIVFGREDRVFAAKIAKRISQLRITKSFMSYYKLRYRRSAPNKIPLPSLLEFSNAVAPFQSDKGRFIVILTPKSIESQKYTGLIEDLAESDESKGRFLLLSTVESERLSKHRDLFEAVRSHTYISLASGQKGDIRVAIQQLSSWVLDLDSTHELSERDALHRAKLARQTLILATIAALTLSVFWAITLSHAYRAHKALRASEEMASFFRHTYLDTLRRNGMDATAEELQRQMDHGWSAEEKWTLADWEAYRQACISLLRAQQDEDDHQLRAAHDGYMLVQASLRPLYERQNNNFDVLDKLIRSAHGLAEIDRVLGNFEESQTYNSQASRDLLIMQEGASGAQAKDIRSRLADLYLENAVLDSNAKTDGVREAASSAVRSLLSNDFDQGGSSYIQSQFVKAVSLQGAECISKKGDESRRACRPQFEQMMQRVLSKFPLHSTDSVEILINVGRMTSADALLYNETDEKSMSSSEQAAWKRSSAYFTKSRIKGADQEEIEFEGYLTDTCAGGIAVYCNLAVRVFFNSVQDIKSDRSNPQADPERQARISKIREIAQDLQRQANKATGGNR